MPRGSVTPPPICPKPETLTGCGGANRGEAIRAAALPRTLPQWRTRPPPDQHGAPSLKGFLRGLLWNANDVLPRSAV